MVNNFTNSYKPFARGRWYKVFIESNGSIHIITKSDFDQIDTESNFIKFPQGFHVLERILDVHSIEGTVSNVADALHIFDDTCQGTMIPAPNGYDYLTVYVFGYFE